MRNETKTNFNFRVICSFVCAPVAEGQKSGSVTKKYSNPECAHITYVDDMGKVRRIRGKLISGFEKSFEDGGVVALYKIVGEKEIFIKSYLTGKIGTFRFTNLRKGTYLLKTGSINFGFNCRNIKVVLAPKDSDSSNKDLEIEVELGT